MTGQIAFHYRVLEKLGAGGMGVVYRAEDLILRRQVALKLLPSELASQPERRSRFLREARTAAALNHPNICTIYEVGEVDAGDEPTLRFANDDVASGAPFIAMEVVEGRTLADVLTATGPLSLRDVLAVAVQVAEALTEAHARKIVHRDLKPQNVMVDAGGRVKILDFGLAKPLESPEPDDDVMSAAETFSAELSRTGKVVGTIAYMSPEQALGKPVDSRSDIFSFGGMIYEMITGKRPFQGETVTSTLAKILEAEPEPLSELTPELPADLSRIVRRCLQKNPAERYHDTRDLAVDLKELHQTVSSGAVWKASSGVSLDAERASTALAPVTLWKRRRTKLVISLSALLAVVTAIVVGLNLLRRRPSSPVAARHQQITFVGDASDPAISPDGKSVAYVTAPAAERQAVMVQDVAGGRALEIFPCENCGQLRWSPDGSEILFRHVASDSAVTLIVPRLGGAPRQFDYHMIHSWSPDGSHFAGAHISEKRIDFINKSTGTTTSIAIEVSFTWLQDLDWSPGDGWLSLLTIDDEERYAVWTVKSDGSQLVKVVEDTAPLFSPRWSPSGDAIYYLRGTRALELWKIRVSPTKGSAIEAPRILLPGLQAGPYFTLSGAGDRMAYTRELVESNLWLFTVDVSGEDSTLTAKPLTTGTLLHEGPRISPDGSRVVFSRGDGETANIFVMPIEGGPPQQLTLLSANSTGPVWSPDGEEIAFASTEGGAARVWKVRADGDNPQPFVKSRLSAGSSYLEWAPGADVLYHRPGNRNFHVLDPRTGEERPLVKDDSVGWMFSPRYSPDGKSVAVLWNRERFGVWVVSVEDTSEALLHEMGHDPIGWSADGRWIYALDSKSEPPGLTRIPATGGPAETTATFPTSLRRIARLSCDASDGTHFVCAIYERQSDAWMVEEFDPDG